MADPRPDAKIASQASTIGGILGPLVFGRSCWAAKESAGRDVEVRLKRQV
jgi:hypothetical protein